MCPPVPPCGTIAHTAGGRRPALLASLPQPLALIEVGASVGLCLYPDRYRYRYDDGAAFGPADGPVTLTCRTSVAARRPPPAPRVTGPHRLRPGPRRTAPGLHRPARPVTGLVLAPRHAGRRRMRTVSPRRRSRVRSAARRAGTGR
ncbi:DUF2332 family protein [Streptomyces sp. NPDC004520]|uniref:DUF2332 family protein n=1 Tax=Streptomyces sp. NPDC004520 TaxID=3364702 RepID=UPI00367B79D4